MIADGVEDQEKWLSAGVAGLQQNAFHMHRALVHYISLFSCMIYAIRLNPSSWITIRC